MSRLYALPPEARHGELDVDSRARCDGCDRRVFSDDACAGPTPGDLLCPDCACESWAEHLTARAWDISAIVEDPDATEEERDAARAEESALRRQVEQLYGVRVMAAPGVVSAEARESAREGAA